ncbi:MAG TPA: translation elongation factor Ts [Acidimicrobiia bacterium]|nr:translation elongation factor Ts [Acidimicrobiia bacterium]
MAEVSAKDVAALRKATGAGMMDCKKALEESGGDLETAKDWLRAQGITKQDKRAGRGAEQGAVDVVVEGNGGAVVELTCETDFVAKGADFRELVTALALHVAEHGDNDIEGQEFDGGTVGDAIKALGAKVGENVGLGRVTRFESADGVVDGYKHIQFERGTIGVLVEVGGVDQSDAKAREVAHELALHIASAAPRYTTRDAVPSDIVEKERSVLEELTRNEGKPEQAVPKIVEGRLNGFYKDVVLVEQPFVRDPKTTVGKLLDELGGGATVRRFVRVKIGEE